MDRGDHKGNIVTDLELEEHDGTLYAKRTCLISSATIYAVVDIAVGDEIALVGNLTLDSGSKTGIVGNVTVDSIASAWSDPKTYIGLVTVGNTVDTTFSGNVTLDEGSKTQIVGNLTLDDPKGFVGLVSVSGFANPLPVDATGQGDVPVTLDGETPGVAQSGNWDVGIVRGNVTVEQGDDPWKTQQVGNVTIDSGNISLKGNVTLEDPKTYIGLVTNTPILSSTVVNFMVSTGSGERTQFPSNTIRQGIIQARSDNDANVFIGNSNVTSGVADEQGIELAPGQATGIEIDDTNKLYLSSATSDPGVVNFLGSG